MHKSSSNNKSNKGKSDAELVNEFLKKLSLAGISISDLKFDKRLLAELPKWLHGGYGRTFVKGKTIYTNIPSFVARRLGLGQHFGRYLSNGSFLLMIGTTTVENGLYYKEIIQNQPSFEQVQDHYNNPLCD